MLDIKTIKTEFKAKQNEFWKDFDSDPPAELLHYAPPDAFRSIVTKKELWCTDFVQVNDPEEGHYGMDLVRLVSREKSVPNRFRHQLRQGDFGMKDVWTQYIACFCSGGEQDYMWSDYAADCTGCALGFDRHKLFEDAANGTKYALFPVLYDRAKQVELLRQTFDHAIHYARGISLSNRDSPGYWLEVVFPLLICATRFKAPKWNQEHEVRLSIFEGYPTASSFESGGKRRLRLLFNPSAITRIVRGREAGQGLSTEKIRAMLNEHGYRNDLPIDDACVGPKRQAALG